SSKGDPVRQASEIPAARVLEYHEVELGQDGVEVVEYVRLDILVSRPGDRVGEAVDLQRQALRGGRKLTDLHGHALVHAGMGAQVGFHIGAEGADIGGAAGIGRNAGALAELAVPLGKLSLLLRQVGFEVPEGAEPRVVLRRQKADAGLVEKE